MDKYTISISFDDETQRWYTINDDIPIILEDGSLDKLIYRIKLAAPEILELNGKPHKNIHLIFKMEAQAIVA